MDKNHTSSIILFIAFILVIALDKLGFTFISLIGRGAVTIAILILALPNINAMNKKIFAIAMSITIAPGLVLMYAIFFDNRNTSLMYGSFICLLLSFPISLTITHMHRKKVQSKLD